MADEPHIYKSRPARNSFLLPGHGVSNFQTRSRNVSVSGKQPKFILLPIVVCHFRAMTEHRSALAALQNCRRARQCPLYHQSESLSKHLYRESRLSQPVQQMDRQHNLLSVLTLIRADNNSGADIRVYAVLFISVAVTRVIALVIDKGLMQVYILHTEASSQLLSHFQMWILLCLKDSLLTYLELSTFP